MAHLLTLVVGAIMLLVTPMVPMRPLKVLRQKMKSISKQEQLIFKLMMTLFTLITMALLKMVNHH